MGDSSKKEGASSDQKIGQILLELKLVDTSQLADALLIQEQRRVRGEQALKLGHILMLMKVLTLQQLQDALRQQVQKAQSLRKIVAEAKERIEDEKSITQMRRKLKAEKEENSKTGWSRITSMFKKTKRS